MEKSSGVKVFQTGSIPWEAGGWVGVGRVGWAVADIF